jgi:hypothetical protein
MAALFRSSLVVACLLSALTASAALAQAPQPLGIEAGPTLPSSSSPAGICAIEPFQQSATLVYFNDGYDKTCFFVQPSDCSACPSPQSLQLNSIRLGTRTFVVCTFQVRVSVVGATNDPCPAPNESDVICPPTLVDVTAPGTASFEATIPLPPGCCVTRPAFVCVQFLYDDCLAQGALPGPPILSTPVVGCASCTNYFSTHSQFPNLMDWCDLGVGYNLWYAIDADCCDPTPTNEHSWGRVKQIYR